MTNQAELRISVESPSALQRRLRVAIPGDSIEQEIERRLKDVGKRAKIKGFRPGKAPTRVVRQQYGPSVRQDVVTDLVQSHYVDAVAQEKLSPVGVPKITPEEPDEAGDVHFVAEFEVYPEVALQGLDTLKITRPEVTIEESDVDEIIGRLRRQRGDWVPVDREAQLEDRVVVDFEGDIAGQPFEGNSGKETAIVLGSGEFIPGFEEGIAGIKAGEERDLNLVFPDDYQRRDLAGEKAHFKVTAHRVEELELPELNDDLAKAFGIEEGGIEALREQVRENMGEELANRIRDHDIQAIGDALVEANPIEVPQALVDDEIRRRQRSTLRRLGLSSDDKRMPDLPREPYVEAAERQVRLGLIIGQLVEQEGFRPDVDAVNRRIEEIAQQSEDPAAAVSAIRANADLMRQVEAAVLEDMTFDWLLDRASVEHEKREFFDFVEPKQGNGA